MTDEFVLNELKDLRRQVEELVTDDKGEAALIDAVLRFPGLVGFWPGTQITTGGGVVDLVNGLDATNNGTQISTDNTLSYVEFASGAKSQDIANNAILNATGTETYIKPAINGCTVIAWLYPTATGGSQQIFVDKEQQYLLGTNGADDAWIAQFRTDGGFRTVTSSVATIANTWAFVAGKFDTTSGDVIIQVNSTVTTSALSDNNLVTGSNQLSFGQRSTVSLDATGRGAMFAICQASVPDKQLNDFFELSRPLFGV